MDAFYDDGFVSDDEDYYQEEEIVERQPIPGEPFFLETIECRTRMEQIQKQVLQKTIDHNADLRKSIKETKAYIASVTPKLKMSKEELKAKIEEAKKRREVLLHSKNLKKQEAELRSEMKDMDDLAKEAVSKLSGAEKERASENQESQAQILKMKDALSTLNAEKRTWKALTVTVDSDVWNMVSEQHKKNLMIEEHIKQCSWEIQKKLQDVQSKFQNVQIYISEQLHIQDATAAEVERQRRAQKEKEENQRFEDLKMEEAKCRPRPNARKNDVFLGFLPK